MAAENRRNGRQRAGIVKRLVMALPLALGWISYTAQPTPGNFLLGYALSLVVVGATNFSGESFRLKNPPRQLFYLVAYTLFMFKEVTVAGMRVARFVLTEPLSDDDEELVKTLDLHDVNTQDSSRSELISAASAHGITMTPGEFVLDFRESAGGVEMIVHSINFDKSTTESTRRKLDDDQSKRLSRIKGILGLD